MYQDSEGNFIISGEPLKELADQYRKSMESSQLRNEYAPRMKKMLPFLNLEEKRILSNSYNGPNKSRTKCEELFPKYEKIVAERMKQKGKKFDYREDEVKENLKASKKIVKEAKKSLKHLKKPKYNVNNVFQISKPFESLAEILEHDKVLTIVINDIMSRDDSRL